MVDRVRKLSRDALLLRYETTTANLMLQIWKHGKPYKNTKLAHVRLKNEIRRRMPE